MRKLVTAGLSFALLILALAWMASPWFAVAPLSGNDRRVVELVVERGDNLADAASRLERAGLISSAFRFRLLARLFGPHHPIKAGEYGFRPGESWQQHLMRMQSGVPIQRLVVVPEGTPSILVYEKLMGVTMLTGSIAIPAEGSILPDSYGYQRGESRAAVLKRMTDAMTKQLDALWAKRSPRAVVASKRDAIILASVVEKETGKPSERRQVAGVYSNRLRIGMPLQADPTIIYPVTRGKPLGRRILRSELQADNGYNTYARAGLPAGPIANPGREAIAAVLDPAATRALYFVADGTGGHVFADTLAEHNANVSKWYAIRRQRGEM